MIPLSNKLELCSVAKYVAALLIVNGHLFIFYNADCALSPYMDFGACCVALFFFFSGYGLTHSYTVKGDAYLNGFFRKRFVKILLPLVTAYAVCLPIYALLKGPIDVSTLFSTIFWGGPYLKFSWFVSEISVIYLLFYISMRLPRCSVKWRLMLLSGLIALLMAGLLALNQPLWYIVSLPGFVMGIWYCRYENQIATLSRVHWVILAAVCCAVWLLTWQWSGILGGVITQYRYAFFASFLAAAAFTGLVVMLLSTLTITPPNLYVIKTSYELYLLQNVAMMIARQATDYFPAYWVLTMVIAVGIAMVMHKVNDAIIKAVQR